MVALFLLYRLYILEDRPLVTDLLTKLVLGHHRARTGPGGQPLCQGGVLANLGGLIFLAVPLLWFFIGRAVADDTSVALLLKAVVAVALIVGLYGVFQTEWSVGEQLPAWDQEWFEVAGYSALTVADSAEANNTVRAFSTFPSNGEYSNYLAIGVIIVFALALHRRFWPILLAPFLAVAIFYSGGRATMALLGLAVVFLIGMRSRNGPLAALIIVAGVGAIFGLAAVAGPRLDQAAGVSDNAIASRNIQGLATPLDPGGSGVRGGRASSAASRRGSRTRRATAPALPTPPAARLPTTPRERRRPTTMWPTCS